MAVLNNKQFMAVGVGAVALFLYSKSKAVEVAEGLNPLNDDNYVMGAVNSLGGKLTGDTDYKLGIGSWLHDVIHGEVNTDIPTKTGRIGK
jgi:hypothetical protein